MSGIVPRHLRTEELSYEIKIRGKKPDSNSDDKRKTLQGLIKQENEKRASHKIQNTHTFEEDESGVEGSLADIGQSVANADSAELRRLNSRLNHVAGRINRMVVVSEEEGVKQQKLETKLLHIESDIFEKQYPSDGETSQVLPSTTLPINTTFKKVPVYKWGIKKFSGDTSSSLMTFLELVASLCTSRGCTEQDLFATAGDLFEGDAWTWWHNNTLKKRFVNWTELVEGLKQTFLTENYDETLLREIKARKQTRGEQVSTYISSMEAMFNRLIQTPTEAEIVKIIKRNLLPDYVKLLALHDINTISNLSSLSRRLETSLQNDVPTEPLPIGNVRTRFQTCSLRNRPKCWNCDRIGHTYTGCFAKKTIFCHGCGRKGVVKVNCGCSKNERRSDMVRRDAHIGNSSTASAMRN